jgi:hypothetical protein
MVSHCGGTKGALDVQHSSQLQRFLLDLVDRRSDGRSSVPEDALQTKDAIEGLERQISILAEEIRNLEAGKSER